MPDAGEPTPAEVDPTGETYCFERGARKDTVGSGYASLPIHPHTRQRSAHTGDTATRMSIER